MQCAEPDNRINSFKANALRNARWYGKHEWQAGEK